MKALKTLGLLTAAFSLVSVASAIVIDFEGLPYTIPHAGNTTPNPSSVITTYFESQGVIFGKAGVSAGVAVVRDSLAPSSGLNTVSGLNAAGVIPGTANGASVGDIYFQFVVPGSTTLGTASGISFTVGDGGGDLDLFQIRSYDLNNALIDSQNVSGTSRFLVTIPVSEVNRVEVDFTGDFGYSLDDLTFTPTGGTSVPEGGSMLLSFALTMVGCGLLASWPSRRLVTT